MKKPVSIIGKSGIGKGDKEDLVPHVVLPQRLPPGVDPSWDLIEAFKAEEVERVFQVVGAERNGSYYAAVLDQDTGEKVLPAEKDGMLLVPGGKLRAKDMILGAFLVREKIQILIIGQRINRAAEKWMSPPRKRKDK